MTNDSQKTQTLEKVETAEEKEISEDNKSQKKTLPWWKGKRAKYGLIVGVCVLVIAGGAGIAIANNINSVDTLSDMNRNAEPQTQTQTNDTNSENEASQADKKTEEAKNEVANNVNKTTNSGSSSGGSPASSSSSNNASSSNSNNGTPAHEHTWSPVYKTVHHNAVTEQQQKPVYGEVMICTDCGAINPSREHSANHLDNGGSGGCYGSTAQIGTRTETVVISPAWDEQVISGYTCSCGAVK